METKWAWALNPVIMDQSISILHYFNATYVSTINCRQIYALNWIRTCNLSVLLRLCLNNYITVCFYCKVIYKDCLDCHFILGLNELSYNSPTQKAFEHLEIAFWSSIKSVLSTSRFVLNYELLSYFSEFSYKAELDTIILGIKH